MGASDKYAAAIDAVLAQRQRVQRGSPEADAWGSRAQGFRADPRRDMDSNFEAIASHVKPDDVFIDAGGGAGRFSLPMSLLCRKVINVDPSEGMGVEFRSLASEAGITNATFVQADWLDSHRLKSEMGQGDVTLAAHVTYFVRDIEGFIRQLNLATRRRVIICISNVPPPNHFAKAFRLVYAEDLELSPGHTELLPVLWDMGILPDVVMLPEVATIKGVPPKPSLPQSPEDAVGDIMGGVWLSPDDRERAKHILSDYLDEFFHHGPKGYAPYWRPGAQQMLITWEI